MNKEKALFLLAALLLAAVAFSLILLARSGAPQPAAPALPALNVQQGEPALRDALPGPPLSAFLGPGDPFRLRERTPEIDRRHKPDAVAAVRRAYAALPVAPGGEPGSKALAGLKADKPTVAGVEKGPKTGSAEATVRGPILPSPPSAPRLELAGTVRLAGGSAEWAVLRDRATRGLLSATVGDVLPGTFRLHSIADDAATIVTPEGARQTLPGRFGRTGAR